MKIIATTASPLKWARKLGGALIVIMGASYAMQQLLLLLQQQPQVRHAFYAGLMAATATAAGTLPALFLHRLSQKLHDVMLVIGAGVMLAACMFSLIMPALALLAVQDAAVWYEPGNVAMDILLVAGFMLLLERLVPHQHFIKDEVRFRGQPLRRSWLFVFSIPLLYMSELQAIGASFAGRDFVRAK